jgi:hypothetical protein
MLKGNGMSESLPEFWPIVSVLRGRAHDRGEALSSDVGLRGPGTVR